jgi:hypothetical protein
MTSPISEPPGLGVGADTIRRWQDRGLIASSATRAQTDQTSFVAVQASGRNHLDPFPPIVERWLPVFTVEPAEEASVD